MRRAALQCGSTDGNGQNALGDEHVPVVIAGTSWRIPTSVADQFLSSAGLRWSEWQSRGVIDVVKDGPHRTVYRLRLPSGEYYLKHFRIPDLRAGLQNLVRSSKAAREWHAARRFARLGLPTFEPLALGKTAWNGLAGGSYLIARAISGSFQLDQFLLEKFPTLSPRRQAILRQHLARDLGQLAARLHLAGIEHADFHAGNVLLRPGPVDKPSLFLIDLHAVRFHRSLSRRLRLASLATLNQFFAQRATRADRLRFYLAYRSVRADVDREVCLPIHGDARPVSESPRRPRDARTTAQIAAWEEFCRDQAQAGWNRADRAFRRGNRHVWRLDRGGTRCRGVARLEPARLSTIRDAPEELFETPDAEWCKRSRSHRVAAVTLPGDGDPLRAYWKCDEPRGMKRWLSWLRESAVRCAWEIGHALRRRGVNTPEPLLYVECGSTFAPRHYLLTAAIPNSMTLSQFLADRWPALAPETQSAWRERLSGDLAAHLQRMHASGFDHRDLKFQNILVSADAAHPVCWILDLDRVKRHRWFTRRMAARNLARIHVSSLQTTVFRRTDRLRFLLRYLGATGHHDQTGDWKWWWRWIERWSVRKASRNQARGRPLT